MRLLLLVTAAILLSGCCGRGLWYSSPSPSCLQRPAVGSTSQA